MRIQLARPKQHVLANSGELHPAAQQSLMQDGTTQDSEGTWLKHPLRECPSSATIMSTSVCPFSLQKKFAKPGNVSGSAERVVQLWPPHLLKAIIAMTPHYVLS